MFSTLLKAFRSFFARQDQPRPAQTTFEDPIMTHLYPELIKVHTETMNEQGTASTLEITETVTRTNNGDGEHSHSPRPGKRRKLDIQESTIVPTTETSEAIDNMFSPSPEVEKDLPLRSKDVESNQIIDEGNGMLQDVSPQTAPDGDKIPDSQSTKTLPSNEGNEGEEHQDASEGSVAGPEVASTTLPETPAQALEATPPPEKGTQPDNLERAATASPTESGTQSKPTDEKASPQPMKATHVRFGSEEAAFTAQSEVNVPLPPTPEVPDVEPESEDDAPEAITLSSGLDRARQSALDAGKAAERQETAAKKRRQARDAQLKSQAQTSRKSKKRKLDKLADLDSQEDDDLSRSETLDHAPQPSVSRFKLPALLPDSILATEPSIRPPTPPLEPETRIVKSKRHQFFEADDKPPKDIRRGPVNVRVLESKKSRLPPKASKTSKVLREAWLSGRRGKDGKNGFERQKVATGFLRR